MQSLRQFNEEVAQFNEDVVGETLTNGICPIRSSLVPSNIRGLHVIMTSIVVDNGYEQYLLVV